MAEQGGDLMTAYPPFRAIIREPGKVPGEYVAELLMPDPQTRIAADLTGRENRVIGWNNAVRRVLELLREIETP